MREKITRKKRLTDRAHTFRESGLDVQKNMRRPAAGAFFYLTSPFIGQRYLALKTRWMEFLRTSTHNTWQGSEDPVERAPASPSFLAGEGTGQTMTMHPEDARLSTAKPLDVTLYTRPGCHLCEEAKAAIEPLLREFGANLQMIQSANTLL